MVYDTMSLSQYYLTFLFIMDKWTKSLLHLQKRADLSDLAHPVPPQDPPRQSLQDNPEDSTPPINLLQPRLLFRSMRPRERVDKYSAQYSAGG